MKNLKEIYSEKLMTAMSTGTDKDGDYMFSLQAAEEAEVCLISGI
ncbi:MAG: hypothetical protein ACLUOI_16160 [Eisenbergiella sp.]